MNNEIIIPNETLVVTCRIHTPIKNILKVGDVVTTPCKDYYNFFVHYATELSRHYECFIPTMLGEKEIAKMNAEVINKYSQPYEPYEYVEPMTCDEQNVAKMNEKYINECVNKYNTEYLDEYN